MNSNRPTVSTFFNDVLSSLLRDLYSEKGQSANKFVQDLNSKTDSELSKLLSTLYQNPPEAAKLAEQLGFLTSITLDPYGTSNDTWHKISHIIVSRLPEVISKQNSTAFIQGLLNNQDTPNIKPLDLAEFTKEGYQFKRALGRTLLLKNTEGDMVAIKIQKAKEDREELIKEYKTTKYIREHAKDLHLEGKMPYPQSVNTLSEQNLREYLRDIPSELLQRFNSMIGEKPYYHTYIYKVDRDHTDYFTYLHDISLTDEQFRQGNRVAVGNIYKLLSQQLTFPQLADLFHKTDGNINDKGRYQVLLDLLKNVNRGSGKLRERKKAVAFPNVRGPHSGLADFGDYAPLGDWMYNGELTKKYFSECQYMNGHKVGNYLLANLIAEYQYVFFLIAGCRGESLTEKAIDEGKSKEEINAIWNKIAKQILENAALAVSILTAKSEQSVEEELHAIIDADRLARQMQFWMTPECVLYLKNFEMPVEIYGQDTNVWLRSAQNLNEKLGFSADGVNADLGQESSQEPIKEANKLFYWLNNLIMGSYLEFSLTYADVKKLGKETQPQKIIEECERSFSHLPKKQYHKANLEVLHVLKNKLQKEKKLTPEIARVIDKKLDEHQKNYAAAGIQTFWKKKKIALIEEKTNMEVTLDSSGLRK